jgi:hypothetical protein
MNNPEYILVEEIGTIVEAVKTSLNLSVLNYQFGYVTELVQTLQQYDADPSGESIKFPLVWFAEPVDINRGEPGIYGKVEDANIFIINATGKDWKAKDRIDNNFKPVLYPIYRELLKKIIASASFDDVDIEKLQHKVSNRYWWGENEKSVLNDIVDCI